MKSIDEFVKKYDHIVIIQADNPDADSVSSALALEQILTDMGKTPLLYCAVDIPHYLRYLSGWDRINHELPKKFDASIIVDTSAAVLLENLQATGEVAWLKSKPCLIIDHHASEPTIDFATIICKEQAVSTTEVIYRLAKKYEWPLADKASEMLSYGLLSDSLGLTSESTTAQSIFMLGELVEQGVELAKLENNRRELSKKKPEILNYKGELLQRVEYSDDGQIAMVDIPWEEIEKYSNLYNPSVLVLDEMRQVENVAISIAFKLYPDGRITGKVRANYGFKIADKLAEDFGGGGHAYASGFRITDGRSLANLKEQVVSKANELLEDIN